MTTLSIDIETYSDNDIKFGVYKYTDTPNFEILIFAYSLNGEEVVEIDLTEQALPQSIIDLILDKSVLKTAYNAQFERVCLSRYLERLGLIEGFLDPVDWRCTMVKAQELGLPASLKQCANYLNLEEQKDTAGTALINYFSKPCKPTKANGMRTRNLPEHAPDKWEAFKAYCGQDVRTEMAIAQELSGYKIHEREWEHYQLDQRMHDRGTGVDLELAQGAMAIDQAVRAEALEKMGTITGLENPNSVSQIKEWLSDRGYEFPSLGKALVEATIQKPDIDQTVKKVLELRLARSNTSTKKYVMMADATCSDGRIRGLLQFYGATRTGRYAGRLLQVQNLPRNYTSDIDDARELVKAQDIEALELLYDDVPDVLKQLIRTGLIAKDGHTFHVSDFSAIEARVIAWYAGEKWVLDAFRTHGKIYEATADSMFNLGGVDKVSKDMRQRGKVATLALGYQGGVGALKAMGALNMGIQEDELQNLVDLWRRANSKIVNFWYDTQKQVIAALETGRRIRGAKGLKFYKKGEFLFIELPSGRCISYARPKLEEGKYGQKITYEGQGQKVYFEKEDTYGGKLVENIVQATARDILAEALQRLEANGYDIVFHVHDEAVCEVPIGSRTIEEMNAIMSVVPEWAKGLPLSAEGFETKYYMKD